MPALIDHRKCDRNAELAINHVIQVAVTWVKILVGVAVEFELVKKEMVEFNQRDGGIITAAKQIKPINHELQAFKVERNVKPGILVAGENQGCFGQRTGLARSNLCKCIQGYPPL